MSSRYQQRGDTIIEVLLAIAVFGLLAVGAITIMNQGTNTTQRSLELTLVKQQIDAQAEALRAVYQQQLALKSSATPTDNPVWTAIKGQANMTTPLAIGAKCPDTGNFGGSFALNAASANSFTTNIRSMNEAAAPPYAQIVYAGPTGMTDYGIWIEKQNESAIVSSSIPAAYTFRVRACWYGAGSNVPSQLQTIVRIYEAY